VINANPIAYGSSGSRSFFSDQSMVIRENYGPEPATSTAKSCGNRTLGGLPTESHSL